jgi:hypothetical protein
MNQQYNQMNVRRVTLSDENWQMFLKKPISERPEFSFEDGTITIGQIVGKFLGIPVDTDEYYNQLFDYVHSGEWKLNLLSEETLDKSIHNTQFQAIQKVMNIHRDQKLSINRFTAFLDGEQLLVKSQIPVIHRKIREAMIQTLDLFSQLEAGGLHHPDLRRVLVDIVKWSFNHLEPLLEQADPRAKMPKFLWYGDAKKSHQYFLDYILRLGCDVLIFHPEGKDVLSGFLPDDIFLHRYQMTQSAEPFPKEKRTRKSTIAYRASREIETILNHEGSGLYKPWQLRDYIPSSVTLKTTYDELFILCKEIAMIRPDFSVENGEVKIPSLFAKVQGISKNRKEYWDRLHALIELDNCMFFRKLPLTIPNTHDFRFHYRNALGKEGTIIPERMISSHYWPYTFLPVGLQKGLAAAISGICEQPGLKRLPAETFEDVKIYLFTQAMFIPKNIIQSLERFDYSQGIPKLIIFNNEQTGMMTRSDAAIILLLNRFGIDIIVYNPAGHNDIETYLEDGLFDIHWLEDVVFDMEFKEPSKLKKGLFQGFLKNLRGD